MAFTFVQNQISPSTGTAATTKSVTITAGGTGNLICGSVHNGSDESTTLISVKDNNGVSATVADNIPDATNAVELWTFYFKNVSGAPTSIIATFGASIVSRVEVQEWSGGDTAAPLDQHGGRTQASTTSHSTANVTTAANGELIYGTILLGNTASSSITQGSGFTVRNDGGAGPNLACADESQVQTSAGVTAVTFTTGGTDSSCIAIMTFLAATGGAAQVPYQPYFQQMLASKRKPTIGWREGYDHRWRRWRRERGLIVPDKAILRAA